MVAPAEVEVCPSEHAKPEAHWSFFDMAWAKPGFTKGEVDHAGKVLIGNTPDEFVLLGEDDFTDEWEQEWDEALTVINNWRASHGYPLLAMRMALRGRAKKVDDRAIIAQRLKRLSSIQVKLERNPHMALSQMQDIGGCRAVVGTVRHVHRLVTLYEDAVAKNPTVRAEFVKKYDYIASPKKDGYRSVHFVYKYRTQARKQRVWTGLRIEIQLRSRLQHAWATAVETVDTFTKQTLKTGGGMDVWKRFFLLMSAAIARMEQSPSCPDCPETKEELRAELRVLVEQLKVRSVLRGWSSALKYLPTKTAAGAGGASVYLLYLDASQEQVKVTAFSSTQQAKASDLYLSTEKMIKDKPEAQAVLVSVESLQALRSAFPNYFADTRVFINAVNQAVLGRFGRRG